MLPKLDVNICVNNVWAQIDLYGAMVGLVTMITGDTGVYDVRPTSGYLVSDSVSTAQELDKKEIALESRG